MCFSPIGQRTAYFFTSKINKSVLKVLLPLVTPQHSSLYIIKLGVYGAQRMESNARVKTCLIGVEM